jgi:hypothetical protein
MRKMLKFICSRLSSGEAGYALIIVLVLLVMGSLTIVPVLGHLSTALKTGVKYEGKTNELYAADAGIEDAIFEIKCDQLEYVLAGQGYHVYDFDQTWEYELDEPINGLPVTVTIANEWIPYGVDPPAGDLDEIADTLLGSKLMISGGAESTTTYAITINFTPETSGNVTDNLTVSSVGIWIPFGFSYVEDSSNLEQTPPEVYYSQPSYPLPDHKGGQAVVWNFSPPLTFANIPNFAESDGVQSARITFNYTADETGALPTAISWIETDDYLLIDDILPVTWDIDTKIYKITSTAENTEIEAYASRCELRDMNDTIAGDYIATGNSLMEDRPGVGRSNERDNLLTESDATVSTIPSDAVVTNAYLYWAAWYNENKPLDEDCDDYTTNAWTRGAGWTGPSSGRYAGHSTTAEGNSARFLTSKTLNLSGLDPSAIVEVRWEQTEAGTLEPDDALYYSFWNNDSSSWSENFTAFADDIDDTSKRFTHTVPQEYWQNGFKLRFYFSGFTDTAGTDEYCYLDNIGVTWFVPTADTSAFFEIDGDRVYFDENEDPQIDPFGTEELTASAKEWSWVNNRRGYSYSCKIEVTKLVQAYSDSGSEEDLDGNGNATYTVGNVDGHLNDQLAWGGWSLIIVYASPDTAGHRLYLYDRFAFNQGYQNLDFDFDGQPGGDISGFIVPDIIEGDSDPSAGHLTCFVGEGDDGIEGDKALFTGQSGNSMYLSDLPVNPWDNLWNSYSPGMTYDGVDVDTFDIPWENDSSQPLVVPGDTTAHLDLRSDGSDAWNLVYLILSLRSKTTIGGTTHYMIQNN